MHTMSDFESHSWSSWFLHRLPCLNCLQIKMKSMELISHQSFYSTIWFSWHYQMHGCHFVSKRLLLFPNIMKTSHRVPPNPSGQTHLQFSSRKPSCWHDVGGQFPLWFETKGQSIYLHIRMTLLLFRLTWTFVGQICKLYVQITQSQTLSH
jgi:hypothetical protein